MKSCESTQTQKINPYKIAPSLRPFNPHKAPPGTVALYSVVFLAAPGSTRWCRVLFLDWDDATAYADKIWVNKPYNKVSIHGAVAIRTSDGYWYELKRPSINSRVHRTHTTGTLEVLSAVEFEERMQTHDY